ncbi:hypothetical protein CHS0354_004320 [Potamilus streckersoni]|uniref:Uncharacterized protein n=1 Tax=Potamilus streckersoni TaxID=2493646 RepID=A0AAE0SGI4_9BIVA|nr:hypothetical protein CHS0354_004320 [Potamilus streckersoni]
MLKKLETLSLENNCLSGLPDSFQNLVNLIQLNLSHNQFINFPAPLCQLRKLDAVDLSRNRITYLPENISTCQSIEINLNQNQISRLPESIADCPRLKVLRLEENCLEISAFTPKVMRESQISLFAVEGNVFDMKTWNHIEGYDQVDVHNTHCDIILGYHQQSMQLVIVSDPCVLQY